MSEARPSFQSIQYAFAEAIRSQRSGEAFDTVPPERMDLYRELIYHNLERFLAGGFPVLKAVFDDSRWQELVGDFLRRHHSTTPYFCGIPEEFLEYLQTERGEREQDPPFLLELAHYEWVELALAIAEGVPPEEDLHLQHAPLESRPFLANTAWPLAYRYPVHRIAQDFRPERPPDDPTYLAVYRDREDRVRFLELNAVTYRLLCLIRERPALSLGEHLDQIASELGYADIASLRRHGTELVCDLARRGIIGNAVECIGSMEPHTSSTTRQDRRS